MELLYLILAKYPKLSAVVCSLVFLIFGALAVNNYVEMRKYLPAPVPISLDQAKMFVATGIKEWVILDHVKWDCHNYTLDEDGKYIKQIVFSDNENSFLGIALFASNTRYLCKNLPEKNVMGLLMPMSQATIQKAQNDGLDGSDYDLSSRGMYLCTYCGYKNYRTGVIVCSLLSLIGFGLHFLIMEQRKQYIRDGVFSS
jgi:hypothetical protein